MHQISYITCFDEDSSLNCHTMLTPPEDVNDVKSQPQLVTIFWVTEWVDRCMRLITRIWLKEVKDKRIVFSDKEWVRKKVREGWYVEYQVAPFDKVSRLCNVPCWSGHRVCLLLTWLSGSVLCSVVENNKICQLNYSVWEHKYYICALVWSGTPRWEAVYVYWRFLNTLHYLRIDSSPE